MEKEEEVKQQSQMTDKREKARRGGRGREKRKGSERGKENREGGGTEGRQNARRIQRMDGR